MLRKLSTYTAGLIGLYLVVAWGTNSGKVITASTGGAANVIKTLQGRA